MEDKSKSGYIKKSRGRKSSATSREDVRKAHKIYYKDDEWKTVTSKSNALDMERSVYVREVSLDYNPVTPDREFRRELMAVRDDLKKFFAFISAQRWSQDERMKKLWDIGFLQTWSKGIMNELEFLNKWIRRF
jgi:hypothetical protein